MRIGHREFTPPWWATALFIAVGVTMLLLGRWQLARASEKIRLMAAADTAASAQPVDVATLGPAVRFPDQQTDAGCESPPRDAGHYTRVAVTGVFDPARQFLWDNRVHKGVAGYEVLTPLMVSLVPCLNADASEQTVALLVNRGWVAASRDRSVLPQISFDSKTAASAAEFDSATPVMLEGMLTQPSKGFAGKDALIDRARTSRPWPAVLQYPDYRAVAAELGMPVLAGVLQATNSATPAVLANLYSNNWSPVANGPEKHYGYAFQWFAMFAALCVIFIVTNLRKH